VQNLYDLVIVGAGASGLSAAIYAGRAKLKALVIEKAAVGGQITITAEVVNYPGIISTDGTTLSVTMKKQAVNFGIDFADGNVSEVDFSKDIKTVTLDSGETYSAVAVIIATGAVPRKLGFEGETEYVGRGIAYCATCDGEFFTGKDVFVIGAGFAAAEEAIFLTRFAKKVTVIAREPEFTCSKTIADKVLAHEQIEVKFNTEIRYVRGGNVVKEAEFINNQTGETFIRKVDEGTFGVFVFVGYEPESKVFKGHVELDDWGYIPANEDMETNIPGVYAAGDIRPKRLRQLVTATADGAIASTAAEKYIEDTKERLGIKIEAKEVETTQDEDVFEEKTVEQIRYVMDRITGVVSVNAVLLPGCELSKGMREFLEGYRASTDKVPVNIYEKGENPELEAKIGTELYPVIALLGANDEYTGVNFHGVPVGHELESFVLAVYNAGGPGQAIDAGLVERIAKLPATNLKIGISLSCTMCPEVVQAGQRIALFNKDITAEMIDLQHFPDLRNKYDVMSVPVIIVNNSEVLFGKKNIEELVDLLA